MRKHLTVVNIGGGHGVTADKTMINIDVDAVLIAVVVDAIPAIRQPPSLDFLVLFLDIVLPRTGTSVASII